MASTTPRDPYEVLGDHPRRRRGRDQEGLPPPGPRAAPRRQPRRPRGRATSSRSAPRPTRSSRTPSAARPMTATATRACARAAGRPAARASARSATSSARSSAAAAGGGFGGGRAGPRQGGDVAAAVDIDLAEAATGVSVPIAFEAVDACAHCRGNGAEPGTPITTCERCGGQGMLQAVSRTPFGQVVRHVACDTVRRRGQDPRDAVRRVPRRGPAGRPARGLRRHPGRASPTASASASPATATPATRARRRATSTSWSASGPTSASCATATT